MTALEVALTMTALTLGLAVLWRVTRSAGPPRHSAVTPPPGVASNLPAAALPDRCEVCGYALAASLEDGCVPGNCSYRPTIGTAEYHRIMRKRTILQGTAR